MKPSGLQSFNRLNPHPTLEQQSCEAFKFKELQGKKH
jgi:hypothetical protein